MRGGWNRGTYTLIESNRKKRFPDSRVFVENSTFPRHRLKKRIIDENMLECKKCAICGMEATWQGKPMILILDHINGKNNDNRLENLRLICSNCDSQLPTYKSKNRAFRG